MEMSSSGWVWECDMEFLEMRTSLKKFSVKLIANFFSDLRQLVSRSQTIWLSEIQVVAAVKFRSLVRSGGVRG